MSFTSWQPVEGDAVALAGVVLTVAEMDGARIRRVALRLPRGGPPSGGRR